MNVNFQIIIWYELILNENNELFFFLLVEIFKFILGNETPWEWFNEYLARKIHLVKLVLDGIVIYINQFKQRNVMV